MGNLAAALLVAVLVNVQSVRLNCDGGFNIEELEDGRTFKFDAPLKVSASGNVFRLPVRVINREKGKFLTINGRRYRGTLVLRKASSGSAQREGSLQVITEIGLDDYVSGVLPMEVSRQWPPEALKAQAVASRTFSLHSLNRHNQEGYDLCSTVHCQVFGGLESEDERTNQAVSETRKELLLYNEKPAGTFFFSNCGGNTQYPVNVWEKSGHLPYLRAVRCKYCKREPHFLWKNKVSSQDIAAAFARANLDLKLPLLSIQIKLGNILIRHGTRETQVRGAKFRTLLGANVIRSTHITQIKKIRGGFLFKGRGWGHGVGMCQEGAKGMALKGFKYPEILKFYYSGTKLKKI